MSLTPKARRKTEIKTLVSHSRHKLWPSNVPLTMKAAKKTVKMTVKVNPSLN